MKYEDIKTPEELLDYMSNIKYGIATLNDEYFYEDEGVSNNIDKWTLESPERLQTTLCGHCFDQVELERDWFSKHGYNFKTIFLIFALEEENDCPTHTLLAYEKDNKWYHFENADYYNRGIHEYNTFKDLVKNAMKRQIEYAAIVDSSISSKLNVYEYTKPEYNIHFLDFIDSIVEENIGKLINID